MYAATAFGQATPPTRIFGTYGYTTFCHPTKAENPVDPPCIERQEIIVVKKPEQPKGKIGVRVATVIPMGEGLATHICNFEGEGNWQKGRLSAYDPDAGCTIEFAFRKNSVTAHDPQQCAICGNNLTIDNLNVRRTSSSR
jgi:hypothetical protein